MKASDVYLRAAIKLDGMVADPIVGCCYAINRMSDDTDLGIDFDWHFRDNSGRGYWGNNWSESKNEVKQCRVLALLFMSEIAKDSE